MDNDEARQISRLHRVNRTIKEMIRDRVSPSSSLWTQLQDRDAEMNMLLQKYGVSTEEIEVDYEEFKSELTKGGSVESVCIALVLVFEDTSCMLKFGHRFRVCHTHTVKPP
jgi:hypothetical protein